MQIIVSPIIAALEGEWRQEPLDGDWHLTYRGIALCGWEIEDDPAMLRNDPGYVISETCPACARAALRLTGFNG